MESPETPPVVAAVGPSPAPRAWSISAKHWVILLCIVAAGTTLRSVRLDVPRENVFDEAYYGFTARQYLAGNRDAYDPWAPNPEKVANEWTHPPLAKLIIAGTMAVFGDGWTGMRLSSVVMAGVATVLVFLATVALFDSARAGLLASLLYTVEGLTFVHSRLALPESHFTVFFLASIFFYAMCRRRAGGSLWWLAAAGLAAGLTLSVKWTGLYLLAVLGVDFLIFWTRQRRPAPPSPAVAAGLVLLTMAGIAASTLMWAGLVPATGGAHLAMLILFGASFVLLWFLLRLPIGLGLAGAGCLIALPAAVYLASYAHYFSMGYTWPNFLELQHQMWAYHTGLSVGHQYQSRPWQWVLNLRPVWFYVHNGSGDLVANIYDLGNSVVLYFGLAAAGVLAVRCAPRANWPAAFLLAVYLACWLPWTFSPRIMFFYHYLPAVPMLCIASGLLLASWLGNKRTWPKVAAWVVVGLAVAWFAFFLPQMTAINVRKDGWLERQYTWWCETPFDWSHPQAG
jgi:dolichyl-phosphate-mannose--protein O-mannosyl transferase